MAGGFIKWRNDEECGTVAPNQETSSAQEVLDEKGEIFSCGGVYLGQCRQPLFKPGKNQFLHLPTHHHEVLVLKNHRLFRLVGENGDVTRASFQEIHTTQETLRKFFKESLN